MLAGGYWEEEMVDMFTSAGVKLPKYTNVHELVAHVTQCGWVERLWRAKIRHERGSIVAIMDGLAIVERVNVAPPSWLATAAIESTALLSTDAPAAKRNTTAKALKKEKTKLKVFRQVGFMSKLYTRCKLAKQFPDAHWKRMLPSFSKAMEQEAVSVGIDLSDYQNMTLERASEVTAIYLRATPSFGSAPSVAQNYKLMVDSCLRRLGVDELSPPQAENLAMDLRWAEEKSLRALGLWDDLSF